MTRQKLISALLSHNPQVWQISQLHTVIRSHCDNIEISSNFHITQFELIDVPAFVFYFWSAIQTGCLWVFQDENTSQLQRLLRLCLIFCYFSRWKILHNYKGCKLWLRCYMLLLWPKFSIWLGSPNFDFSVPKCRN